MKTQSAIVWVLAGALLLALPGAAAPPQASAAAPRPFREVTDETGRVVRVPVRVERVVSLAPNITEIIFGLQQADRLVGVTNQCDFPPAAATKEKIGDVINPSLERIIALKPDLVLGTTAGNRRETVDALDHAGLALYGIDDHNVNDILGSIRRIADLLGVPEAGEKLATQLSDRLAAVEARLAGAGRPRVLVVIWLEPLLTAGGDTFLTDVLRRAGGQSITAGLNESWPRLSVETVVERDPDYLVLPRIHSLQGRMDQLQKLAPWKSLRVMRENRVVWVEDALLRPGPRIVDIIEELARALHPESFGSPEAARP